MNNEVVSIALVFTAGFFEGALMLCIGYWAGMKRWRQDYLWWKKQEKLWELEFPRVKR